MQYNELVNDAVLFFDKKELELKKNQRNNQLAKLEKIRQIIGTRHSNGKLNKYRFSDQDMNYYEYSLDDKYFNKEMHHNYVMNDEFDNIEFENITSEFFNEMISDDQFNDIQIARWKRDNNFTYAKIKYIGNELIYCNMASTKKINETILIEPLNITKQDYAYCTLFFPMYNDDFSEIRYTYLPPTLLVAYLLKTRYQNIQNYSKEIKGTRAKIICMVTPDVEKYIIDLLLIYYDEVKIVPYIAWKNVHLPQAIKQDRTKFIEIGDVSVNHIKDKHAYNRVFTKLHLFDKKKFNYKKVILLDTDLFPMCYFDSLFSIDTPAGWLEHRRGKERTNSVSSWRFDRCDFVGNKNGGMIPKMLTDIELPQASDINASLYIVSPDYEEFDNMIKDLQQTNVDTWFKNDSEHKGFWLGNKLLRSYILPEQNYLTKRFSGKWHSVDMSYSTWLIDTDKSFGFTFAGWVVKPWLNQSMGHAYSKNMTSIWSKTHNKHTQKSYSMQILNNLFCKMILDLSKIDDYNNSILVQLIKKELFFTTQPFDPWITEHDLNNSKIKFNEITPQTYKFFSYDQLKLIYMCSDTDDNKLLNSLTVKYTVSSITKYYFPVVYFAISYNLCRWFINILSRRTSEKYGFKYMGFGKTLIAANLFHSFNYTDDDNDFVVTSDTLDQNNFFLFLIDNLLVHKLQVNVFVTETDNPVVDIARFTQISIFADETEFNSYCDTHKSCYTLNDLNTLIANGYSIRYINFSPNYFHTENEYRQYYDSDIFPDILYQKSGFLKIPWIDVFYGVNTNGMLAIPSIGKQNLPVGTFNKQQLYNFTIYEPDNLHEYLKSNYLTRFNDNPGATLSIDEYVAYHYLNNFIIKAPHGNDKNAIRKVINLTQRDEAKILFMLNKFMDSLVIDYAKNLHY